MTDEEIFDLADQYGWMDDFGRWNFKDEGLIKFALALMKSKQETMKQALDALEYEAAKGNDDAYKVERDALRQAIAEAEKPWVKTYCGGKPNYTVDAIDMSEKHVQISDKNRHEFFCPRCGHCCREWVGLTDDEVFNIYKQFDSLQYKSFAQAIEAKLKEKNA